VRASGAATAARWNVAGWRRRLPRACPQSAPARCPRHSPARDVAAIPVGRSIRRPWVSAVASAIVVEPAMAVALTRVPPALRLVPELGRGLCHVRVPVLPGAGRTACLSRGPLPPSASPRQQLKLRDSEAVLSVRPPGSGAPSHKSLAGSSKTDELAHPSDRSPPLRGPMRKRK
jgi:hypothetical protein